MAAGFPTRKGVGSAERAAANCCIPGKRFSHLPEKHRAELTLPPTRVLRALAAGRPENAERRASSSTGERVFLRTALCQAATEKGAGHGQCGHGLTCHGSYCSAQICTPAALEDQDLLEGAGGRSFMRTSGSMSGSKTAAAKVSKDCGAPGRILVTWLVEALRHPSLCRWLGADLSWTFDPRSLDQVLAAAQRVREDDRIEPGHVSELLDKPVGTGHLMGLRYRLQTVPVCGRCFCIYKVIHEVVSLIRLQRRDTWAAKEQKRLAEVAAATRERLTREEIERVLAQGRAEAERKAEEPGQAYTDYCYAYNLEIRGAGNACTHGPEWCVRKHERIPDHVFIDMPGPTVQPTLRQHRSKSVVLDIDMASWLHSGAFEAAADAALVPLHQDDSSSASTSSTTSRGIRRQPIVKSRTTTRFM